MKNKKIIQLSILFIFLLIFIKTVYAGVNYPIPNEIQLKPGEEGRFLFIVTSTGTFVQNCAIYPDSKVPFVVEFDETSFTMPQGEKEKLLRGTVSTTKETEIGKYTETFSVTCTPQSEEGEGSTISTTIRNIPVNVDVVGERTHVNLVVDEQKEKPIQVPTYFYFILIAVIIAIIIYIIYSKKNK